MEYSWTQCVGTHEHTQTQHRKSDTLGQSTKLYICKYNLCEDMYTCTHKCTHAQTHTHTHTRTHIHTHIHTSTHTHTYTHKHTHTHTYTHTPHPDSHSLTHTPPHSTHPVLKAHERDVAGTSEHGVCHVWYTSEGVLQNQRQDPSKDRTEQHETDRKHSSERVKETQGHVDNTKRECNDFSECLPNSCMALGETNFPASSF